MTIPRVLLIALLSVCVLGAAQSSAPPHKSRRGGLINLRDATPLAKDVLGLRRVDVLTLQPVVDDAGQVHLDLAIDGVPERITLEPYSNRSSSKYEVLVQHSDGSITSAKPGPVTTYRGTISGVNGSLVAATLDDTGITARIRYSANKEYWLEPLVRHAGVIPGTHALYTPDDVLPHGRSCATEVRKHLAQRDGVRLATGGGACIAELACDADVEYFNDYGTVPATEARINAVMNAVNMQYESEVGITHQITTILVRTANPDPYTSTDAETRLCEFITEWTNNQGSIQRDVAQLFTGVEIDSTTIGIAADIGGSGICVNSGSCTGGPFGPLGSYCMSQSDFNGNFGCATDLSAHELGHLWGAFHCSPNCPGNTMNPGITCANTFGGTSIASITAYRDTRFCLDGDCSCDVACAAGSTSENEPPCAPDYDDTTNGGCNSTVPVWSALSPGQTVCGESGTFTVGGNDSRDTDWYQFTLAQGSIVSWCVEAEFPVLFGFVDDGGGGDCANAAFLTSTTGAPCQLECITTTLAAGTWTAFVAPEIFTSIPCGSTYNATLELLGACCDGPTCAIASQTECASQGSSYLGDGTDCESTSGSPTTYQQTVNQSIPDSDPGNPLVTILNVPDAVTIGDVDIALEIPHTWVGDLVVTLEHNGTSVTLIDRPGLPDIDPTFGCSSNNYDATLDDEGAGGAIEDLCLGNDDTLPTSPPNYTPSNSLSAFDGLDSSGNWTLTLADFASPDPGSLTEWSLIITAQGPNPCDGGDLCAGVDCSAFDDDCAVGVCNAADGMCSQDTASFNGVECRAAAGPCDVAEACDGVSATCPSDGFATGPCDDGDPCTDNDTCLGGACVSTPISCDDSNPCTDDSCVAGVCQNTNNTDPCNDGDACTSNDTCAGGACDGTPLDCNDGNPCTDDSCVAGMCQNTNNTDPCNDGDACTSNDTCAGGACDGTPLDCDDGNPCTDDSCVAGACQNTNNTDPCNDGNACTSNDTCAGGACDGTPLDCNDGNPCTDDSCVAGACQNTNNTDPCNDGDACTSNDTCAGGACDGTPLDCNDGNPCTDDSCVAGACQNTNNTDPCNDGDACTSNDTCAGGACDGTPLDCDDGNPCTDDNCVAGACQNTNNTDACNDGDACTSNDTCAGGVCDGTPLDCDDGNPCTDDSCVAGACHNTNNTDPCNDGDACTSNDTCAGGACDGTPLDCDDGNPCTDDNCVAGVCQNTNNTDACNDGDACTSNDTCAGGVCDGTPLDCDDGNPCTDDSCVAGACHNTNNTNPCDDDDACTTGDTCSGGSCTGAITPCDDGNPCTDDACVDGSCVLTNNNADCDDGDVCTENDFCFEGACTGLPASCTDNDPCTVNDTCTDGVCSGTAMICDDGNICTDDTCIDGVCVNTSNAAACDDSDDCTENDVCSGGFCNGETVVCNDDNPCTDDSCVAGVGCVFDSNTATCDDGDACTTGDVCIDGSCAPGLAVVCDDGNPCTDDGCDMLTGCIATCSAAGGPCDAGDGPGSGTCNGICGCNAIGPNCLTNADCHDQDNNGIRDDACVWWSCDDGVCTGIDIVFADMGGPFGECPVDGVADGNDRFHALNCFGNIDPNVPPPSDYPCEEAAPVAFAVDPVGPFGACAPDGVCDGNDAFAALNAFGGTSSCSCPLDDPAPQFDPGVEIVDHTTVIMAPAAINAHAGDIVEVDILLGHAVRDLRGYQLHLDIRGGRSGDVELIDIVIEQRRDAALAGLPTWQAANIKTAQVVVGTDQPGIFAAANSYLATVVVRIDPDATGEFRIDVLSDWTDPTQRTYLFPTRPHQAVAIDGTSPVEIRVQRGVRRLRR